MVVGMVTAMGVTMAAASAMAMEMVLEMHYVEVLVNFIFKAVAVMGIAVAKAMVEVAKQVAAIKILLVQDAAIEMQMVMCFTCRV
jgi:hypothetical protein